MRKDILLILVLVSLFDHAGAASKIIREAMPEYRIVSDVADPSVQPGTFRLMGHVYEMYGDTPVNAAVITNSTETNAIHTDESGYFNIIFSVKEEVIYCYKNDWFEILFRGPFPDGHCIEINFYSNHRDINIDVTKPVIYVYNTDDVVTLSIKPKGTLTFIYPKQTNESWTVKCNGNGSLTNTNDGKNYPYLFWEASQSNLQLVKNENTLSGYLINTDTSISFLENALSAYGLNEKESTDFITFWGPKLVEKPYAVIQFLTTETYADQIGQLFIKPEPHSVLRLYMYLIQLDEPFFESQLINEPIPAFERTGFTVVEWGGSVLPSSYIEN